jgi:hypothetical protein
MDFLLPICKKISAKTIAQDLVSVMPMGQPHDMTLENRKIKIERRKKIIDEILKGE